MIQQIDLNDEQEIKQIKGYIKSKDSTIFNTIEWLKVIAETYNYKPLILVNKENEKITSFVSLAEINSIFTGKRITSLPFSTYSGFLFDNEKSLNDMVEFLKTKTKKGNFKYLEIKQQDKIKTDLSEKEHYFNSVLDLKKSEEELLKSFDKGTVRWGIKKAEKSGIAIKEENAIEGYKIFYDLMAETRKQQGSPPYPFALFENILKHLRENSRLFLAYYGKKPIAGLVLFHFSKTAHYMYGASRKEKKYLQHQPNNLLIWKAIKWAKYHNCDKFDFGSTPPEHHSLLKFKSRWGTQETKLPYYFYINKAKNIPLYDSTRFGLGRKIWHFLPTFLTKLIGARILRHFG